MQDCCFIYSDAATEEFCLDESFVANCASDEVIVINNALFGRMKVGKCISESLAFFMGCFSNVLTFMEQHCSGRSTCLLPVSSLIPNFKNCTSQLGSYLEVDYSCLKGN